MRLSISSGARFPARRLVAAVVLIPLAVVAGCIEGARFHEGGDAAVRDVRDAVTPDVARDTGGAVADVPDTAPEAGTRDVRDGGPTDAVADALRLDVAPLDTADVGPDVPDASPVPFPCMSDGQCATALGAAPGPCLVAACHPQGRYCFFRALPNGSAADLGDPCVLAAHCELGRPQPTVARECDDGNPCTDDRCEAGTGCTYTPLTGMSCDDANACSSEGTCLAGICVSTTNSCPCTEPADCTPFNDDNECNGRLTCDAGICVVAPETVVHCTPPDAPGCTRLACRKETGVCEPAPLPDGSPCENGDACTAGDACQAGVCEAGPALDCGDGNPCSQEGCDPATGCTWRPLGEGACDDGDACTSGDRCSAGLCDGDRRAACACEADEDCLVHDDDDRCNGVLRCTDGFCAIDRRAVVVCAVGTADCGGLDCLCTRTLCDSATGDCTFEPLPDGLPCGDDDVCTLAEGCAEGYCEPAGALLCDDDNVCTADRCDAQSGCVFEPSDGPCDDGVACTQSDQCAAGACTGEPYECAGREPCIEGHCAGDGTCTPMLLSDYCDIDGVGCVEAGAPHPDDPCQRCNPETAPRAWSAVPDGGGCDDGDACTTGDQCVGGLCEPGGATDCDDDDACTTDGCEPASGCTHDPVVCEDDYDCTDDSCDPARGCTYAPNDAACPDQNPCTQDLCSVTDGCLHDGGSLEGEPCEDGDACTTGTTCSAGNCQGGTAEETDDLNECTTDGCDPASGVSHEPRTGEPCTTTDAMCPLEGECQLVGGEPTCVAEPVDCDDDDPCTDDSCDPETPSACLHDWNTAACDDSDPCTVGDVCAEGVCEPGPDPLPCEDEFDCTQDACEPGFGCAYVPDDTLCDDGGPCTTNTCDADDGCLFPDALDGTPCGADHECLGGTCEWTGACAGVVCPPLPNYESACNAQHHCEYAYVGGDSATWHQWDVWIWVPPGAFPMGRPEGEEGTSLEVPLHTVTFAQGFFLAKFEATVLQYETCQAASPGTCTPPSTADWDGNGWGTNRSSNARETHPQNGLTWAQADAVCAWLGGRLPSEAEWEYAAKGPAHRKYPWGDTPEPTCINGTAVFSELGITEGYGCGLGGTWPVNSMSGGASWVGALDMAGNVWEWVEDWWHANYSGAPTDGSAWVVPSGTPRVKRGGGFDRSAWYLRSAYRHDAAPTYRDASHGARCVRDLSPVGVYCNTACPALPGYGAECNAQNHCEYARSEQTEPWHEWDVWIWVPPGSFEVGCPDGESPCLANERPVHTVSLAEGFFVAKYEVATAAFEACEAAGGCTAPEESGLWDPSGLGLNRVSNGRGAHPQNGLKWQDALAFCRWIAPSAGRLLSEAEWEAAAKGPVYRKYPWGDEPEPTCADLMASFFESSNGCGEGGTWPVYAMQAGAAYVGAIQMSGNVWEWVEDGWHATYDDAPLDGSPWPNEDDPQRAMRGGAYNTDAGNLRSALRYAYAPSALSTTFGARCARDLPCARGETPTLDGCTIPDADCARHADGVLCNDGDACTEDTCQGGVCLPQTNVCGCEGLAPCVSGANPCPGITPCGLNARGRLLDVCVLGEWVESAECDDPDECIDGSTRIGAALCGLNWRGGYEQECVLGRWTDTDVCQDPDECVDGQTRAAQAPCDPGEQPVVRCDEGHWLEGAECVYDVQMVKDINTQPPEERHTPLVAFGGHVYYRDHAPGFGTELWRTDGTAEGTGLVADTNPGPRDGHPDALVPCGGRLFFTTDNHGSGRELWTTDGTAAGTALVADVRTGADGSSPQQLTCVGDVLFFTADDGTHGRELWKSDGSAAGTVLVTDVTPGTSSSWMRELTAAGPLLFFVLFDETSVQLLWASDGSAEGTTQVKDLQPGQGDGIFASTLVSLQNELYFVSRDGALWKSDGTSGGTVRLTDPSLGVGSSSDPTPGETVLYFVASGLDAGTELWVTDGSPESVRMVEDIVPGASGSMPSNLVTVGDTVYFSAKADQSSVRLWRSDGTPAGAEAVYTFESGQALPADLFLADGTLYFTAKTADHGRELWASDGTTEGTTLVGDLRPGPTSSYPGAFTALAGDLFFLASDDPSGAAEGLWQSDGTSEGTARVRSLQAATADASPDFLIRLGDTLVFQANDGVHGRELWRSDGTGNGTSMVVDLRPGEESSNPKGPARLGDLILFAAHDGVVGEELWATDGTQEGTRLVRDINAGDWPSAPRLTSSDGAPGPAFSPDGVFALFVAETQSEGSELWRTDGTEDGTALVRDIREGAEWSNLRLLTTLGGFVLVSAHDGVHGQEIWRSDGTEQGTRLVKDIRPGDGSGDPWYGTLVGGVMYFRADDGVSGQEIWRTDGTEGGTVMVADIRPGAEGSAPGGLAAAGGLLYFSADDGVHGREIWRTDGTPAGTRLLTDILTGPEGSGPSNFVDVNDTLYFLARTGGSRSKELWRSDGTEEGTAPAGLEWVDSSNSFYETEFDGVMLFRINDGLHGNEPWRTDGTPGGSWMIRDIWPGALGSEPVRFTRVGDTLFFVAEDGQHGEELWRMPITW